MTLFAIPFPAIDPILIQFGPIAVRWYALSYIVGILLVWRIVRFLIIRPGLWNSPNRPVPAEVDDMVLWSTLGIIVGGRLGYVLFYNFSYYLENFSEIPMVWLGGMSFHGGLIGMILVTIYYTRAKKFQPWVLFDLISTAAPIGLFFGRIANFINSELWGRITTVPWGVIFPNGGPEPRHPSQIYEALLEGLILFIVLMWFATRRRKLTQPGFLTGAFGVGYGVARIFCEFFRDPDAHIGFIFANVTMGMLLSFPFVIGGLLIIVWSYLRPVKT